ncbi:type II secretion system minor pseudopilin GspJ [Rheinheimera sp. 4Y26]|uniref:type II secretion system minor pseudopilin GspJ n=1 Tax=Rheinheimera sp. 4Y26 TaxID=2977811 RepID=UPI0021B130DE|nr:type II secretion system minor pseudopilin GspJ [Rheinheimera sp. 4Y26]MCT6701285.1 type II secretion system minor pseudopilin GspJ [Rheinheimera sp. 4Y26]
MIRQQLASQRGFTFIEMLLATAIFALVGLASVAVLDSVTRSDTASQAALARLQKLQQVMMLMERDLWQITPRQIRVSGEAPSKVMMGGAPNWLESDDDGLSFSHAGWTNPAMILPRSEVQLVGYRLKENKLERLFYLYPDAVTGTEPQVQVLLEEIDSFKLTYLDQEGIWQDSWMQETMPKALRMVITQQSTGELERIFTLPAGLTQ